MHSIPCRVRAVAALVVGTVVTSLGGWPPDVDRSSDRGLGRAEWTNLRAAYEAGRHAAHRVEDGFEARNPGQRWLTRFDSRGFRTIPDHGAWTWGLALVRYGFAGSEEAVTRPAQVVAEGGRVAYRWNDGLEEWWVNDRRGLEHGFTVSERPPQSKDGPLTFVLAVRGDLRAEVAGRDVRFRDQEGGVALTYSGLTVYDADRRALPARFVAEPEGDELHICVDEHDARYPITVDPIAQQAYLKASNTNAGDDFGKSVAVSGDTAVVGAPVERSNATGVNGNQANNSMFGAGAAYVFVNAGGSWSQQAYLKASNTQANDLFGFKVAISGDTIVVGARSEDSNATGVNGNQANNSASASGAVYVFVRSGPTWSQQAYLKASNTESLDLFGSSLAVSGDTIVVGAEGEDSKATGVNGTQADNTKQESGAAYVFVRSGTTWSQQAYLKASNTDAGDRFGTSVSVSKDTIVVGASWEKSKATGVNGNQLDNTKLAAGAAYVFQRMGSSWSQQAYLKASNTDAGDLFGIAVSVDEDTVAVGASGEDSKTPGVGGTQTDNSVNAAGAVYVFHRDGSTWKQQAYVKASNPGILDQFGDAVSVSGDTLLVGAEGERSNATGINGNQADDSAMNAGAAYVFARRGPGWSQWAYVKASNTGAGDRFGATVAVSGRRFLVGAAEEDSNATGVNGNQADNSASSAGAAYVYSLPKSVALAWLSYLSPKHVIQSTFTGASSSIEVEFTAGRAPWTLKLTVGPQTVTGVPPLTLINIPPGPKDIVLEIVDPGGPCGWAEIYGQTVTEDYDITPTPESTPTANDCEGNCPVLNPKPDCPTSITAGTMTPGTSFAIEFQHDTQVTLREILLFTKRTGGAEQIVVELFDAVLVQGRYEPGTPKTNTQMTIAPTGALTWHGVTLTFPPTMAQDERFFLVMKSSFSSGSSTIRLPKLEDGELTLNPSVYKSGTNWTHVDTHEGWAICFLCDETATSCPVNDTDGETALGASITFKLSNARPGTPTIFLVHTTLGFLPDLTFLGAPTCSSLSPIIPLVFPPFTTSSTGSIALPATIPNVATLSGTKLYTQWLNDGDPQAANPGGVTLSNLLKHEIGR